MRYRPAVGALNVCGDWYDLVDLVGGDRIGVSVGDVVGHGLEAAGVMGQLRSALSAASRVADGPAQALNVLGRYANVVDGAESATVVTTFIDFDRNSITYSSAGHPPPVLLHDDGRVEFLDRATDPPLDARPDPRPEASTVFSPGATLVLYTDGLIERRREDIDVGLRRLAESCGGTARWPRSRWRTRCCGAAAAGRRHGRHGAGGRTTVTGTAVRRRRVRGRGGWCAPRRPGPRGRRWARRTRRRGSPGAPGPR